jgi:putative PEP-CTERM system TPR-repeat lipoprotein
MSSAPDDRRWPGVSLASAGLVACLLTLLLGCGGPQTPEELLASAAAHEQAGDHRAAMIDLKNLLQQDAQNPRGRLMLGRVLLELGDIPAAVKELETAASLGVTAAEVRVPLARTSLALRQYQKVLDTVDPEQGASPTEKATLWRLVGEAQLALGNPAAAVSAFESALALRPDDLQLQLGRAAAVGALQGVDAGRAEVALILKAHPKHAPAWNLLGTMESRGSNLPAAVEAFGKAAEIAAANDDSKTQVAALAGLADAQIGLMQLAPAEASIGRLVTLQPHSALVPYLQARLEFLKGDYEKAQMLLLQILSADPENLQARLMLGAVHYAAGDLGQAAMYLSTVVTESPENQFARQLLTLTRLKEGKSEEAVEALLPALERSTDLPRVLRLAAQAQRSLVEFPDAIEHLERSTRASPENRQRHLALAAAYVAAGRNREARTVLERVSRNRAGPDAREYLLIVNELGAGNRAAAGQLADELEASKVREPALLLLAAQVAVETGDLQAAQRRYDSVLELDARHVGALVGTGQIALRSGNPDAAEKSLKRALEITPHAIAPKIVMASVALARDDPEGARGWLESAIADDPRAVEPRLLLARHHMALGDLAKSRAIVEEALQVIPDDPRALNLLGIVLGAAGEQETSRQALEKAVAQAPDTIGYRLSLARSYQLAGQPDKALAEAKAAVEQDRESIAALTFTGMLALQQRQLELAAQMAGRLRRLPSGEVPADLIDAEVAMAEKRYLAAIGSLERALRARPSTDVVLRLFAARQLAGAPRAHGVLENWLITHPEDQRVRLALAQTQQGEGREQEAIQNYELLLRADAQNAVALNNLAWLYHEQGDNDRAFGLAEKAVALRPRSAAILDTYGWLLVQRGDLDQGLNVLRRAAYSPDAQPVMEIHLAEALATAGRNEEARARLANLLARDPLDEETRREANALMKKVRGGGGT